MKPKKFSDDEMNGLDEAINDAAKDWAEQQPITTECEAVYIVSRFLGEAPSTVIVRLTIEHLHRKGLRITTGFRHGPTREVRRP